LNISSTGIISPLKWLKNYPHKKIEEVITNHCGEPRGKATKLMGILVKDLLTYAILNEESPKQFSEYYFTFTAIGN
jgi:hypothetical protein